jgi:hypothetical protein
MLEDLDQLTCIECGTMIDVEGAAAARVFALTPEVVLCHACAMRRGGVYDDAEDKWKIAPRLEDVATEQRVPHP